MYNEKMAWPGTMKIVFGWAFLWRTMVFGNESTNLGKQLYPDLEEYIDQNYVREREEARSDLRGFSRNKRNACEKASKVSVEEVAMAPPIEKLDSGDLFFLFL